MLKNSLLKTKHIKKAILEYASDQLISTTECDFRLHKVETLLRSSKSNEFEHYSEKELSLYKDRNKLIDEHIEFTQIYTISLYKKKFQEFDLIYKIHFDKYRAHPYLILSPESKIPYTNYKANELLKILYYELNKIKSYHAILIQLFDDRMKHTLKKFIQYIYDGKFIKNIKIPLFDGIEPLIARENKLIFYFEEKKDQTPISEVDKDEILIEYKKPIYGKNGLNAYGKIIDTNYAQNIDDTHIEIDPNSVRIKENKTSKYYISRRKGYIHYTNNRLSVDNKLQLHEISRNREIIDSKDEKNNIDIVISQQDTSKDSIGEGVELISESIHVEGFVGANSRLEAVHLDIKGATHQNAKQFAKFANINRHKGVLRCHEAKIGLLEGGTVYATKVTIDSVVGGEVYAEDVTIRDVRNNLKVYASNSIHIHLVSGEDNFFQISYKDIPTVNAKIKFIKKELSDLKYKLKQAQRFNQKNILEIKEKISTLKTEYTTIVDSYKKATIIIESPLRGLNNIIFTIDQQHSIHYKTEPKAYLPFHLKVQENEITLLPPEISIIID